MANGTTDLAAITAVVWGLKESLVWESYGEYGERESGVTLLPDGTSFGNCTNSARYLQELLGGVVAGYQHEDNPTAELGETEGGHDFLVLPEHIVDLWAAEYYETPAILSRKDDAETIIKLYGYKWTVWDGTQHIPFTEDLV